MNESADPAQKHYEDAVASLKQTLADFDRCTHTERGALVDEFEQLESLSGKLAVGRIDIAVFGEISTGKSALINALAGEKLAKVGVVGGVTRAVGRTPWRTTTYKLPGFADSAVELIDTPGLNEVDGAQRGQLAKDQARQCDLVLFVTDSDLNEIELTTLRDLTAVHKPIILALNKIDLYSQADRERLIDVLKQRCDGFLATQNLVACCADPMQREYIIESTDGAMRIEMRKPDVQVDDLKLRILEILEAEGKALAALNGSMFASDVSDRIRSVKVRLRKEQAQKLILSFAVIKGAAVALNPIPVADVVGGFGADAIMIASIGKVYGETITLHRAGGLAIEIAKSIGWMALAEWLTHAAAHLVKTVTVGAGVVITALPQGLAAAYGSYLVGQAAHYYFEHHSGWAGQSPKKVIRQIIAQTDKASVIEQLKIEIQKKLRLGARSKPLDQAADEIRKRLDDPA